MSSSGSARCRRWSSGPARTWRANLRSVPAGATGAAGRSARAALAMLAARQGARLVLSLGSRAYLDMKYDPTTELGLRWAGLIELRTAYDWDPITVLPGVSEASVLGVEAPLWTESVRNVTAAQDLLLPRLPAIAEVGRSARSVRDWESFRARIAPHAPRWRLLGIVGARRRFEDFSLPGFTALGAATGLLLAGFVVATGGPTLVAAVALASGTIGGGASLADARVAARRGLLCGAAAADRVRLADRDARDQLRDQLRDGHWR